MDAESGAVYWLITVVLSIVLGVVGNLLWHVILRWWARQSVAKAQNRIGKLRDELREVEELGESPAKLVAWSMHELFDFIVIIVLLSVLHTTLFLYDLYGPQSYLDKLLSSLLPSIFNGFGFHESKPVFIDCFGILLVLFFAVFSHRVQEANRFLDGIRHFDKYKAKIDKQICGLIQRHGLKLEEEKVDGSAAQKPAQTGS